MDITPDSIAQHIATGPWRRLEQLARDMVDDAIRRSGSPIVPVLGGGTRLMLALEHRISDDIDLFINDPQWIGYLTPRLSDAFEASISTYDEASNWLKLVCPEGEIDFIVSMSLLGLPPEKSPQSCFPLEPVAEVLAKKLFYRGWALTPRDLFDWHALETAPHLLLPHLALAKLVLPRLDRLRNALELMGQSDNAKQKWSEIAAQALPDFAATLAWATRRTAEMESLATNPEAAAESERRKGDSPP